MELTILGSGNPVPHLDRAGTAFALRVGDEPVLVDCGPGTVRRLMEAGFDPGAFERLFFTHQHMDHNAAFFHLAIAGWMLGRRSFTLYGPSGAERLIDALETIYREDLEYRQSLGRPADGIEDIEHVETSRGFELETGAYRVTAHPVEHSIETHAFRFEADGRSVVFSGDTAPLDSLAEFAAGADVLVHDAAQGPRTDDPAPPVWERFLERNPEATAGLDRVHSSPREAGEVAADAGVETLVLNHLSPYADVDAHRELAASAFTGSIVAAEDGLVLPLDEGR